VSEPGRLRFQDHPADPAEYLPAAPGKRTPKIEIRITTEISGEWVTPEMIAHAARELANSMASKLREAADDAPRPHHPQGDGPVCEQCSRPRDDLLVHYGAAGWDEST
jgi:hypothetical protein